MGFIDRYIEAVKHRESHPLFDKWVAISLITAACGRNVWSYKNDVTFYPNLYILLAGPSGKIRKSTAIGPASEIIPELKPGINLVSQKSTPEGLLSQLDTNQIDSTEPGSPITTNCMGYLIVSEFVSFLNKRSYEAGMDHCMLELFDCPPRYEYNTRTKGKIVLKDGGMNILACSTLDAMRKALPKECIGS